MRVIFYSQIFILLYGFIVSYSLNGADGFYPNPRPALALMREGVPRTLRLKKKREQEEWEIEKELRQAEEQLQRLDEQKSHIKEERKQLEEERTQERNRQMREQIAANRKKLEQGGGKDALRRKSALRLAVQTQQQKNAAQEAQECSFLINPWSAMQDLVIEDQESGSDSDE